MSWRFSTPARTSRQVVLLTLLLASTAQAAAPLSATVTPTGMCWWHCAEAVLRERGTPRNLIDEVRATGRLEASIPSVERFLEVDLVPTFQEAVPLVHGGTHVIATLKVDGGRHAFVIVDVNERVVTLWNPNEPTRYAALSVADVSRRWVVGVVIR